MNFIQQLFEATNWIIEKPKAYGPFHLLFFFIGITIVIVSAIFIKKSSEKTIKIILVSCGAFLVLTEVYKQLFYFYNMGNQNYVWWIFPFQMCSVPMYLLLFVPFLKEGKVKNALYNYLAVFSLFGGFVSFFEPSGLLHPEVTLLLHAFVWHMMLVFTGVILVVTGKAVKSFKDFLGASIVFIGLCSVAEILNIIFRNKDGFNMFYISPFVRSPIAVFKDFYVQIGWLPTSLLYVVSITIGAFIIFLAFYYGGKLLRLIIQKSKKNHQNKANA